jgi:hypothetical protein
MHAVRQNPRRHLLNVKSSALGKGGRPWEFRDVRYPNVTLHVPLLTLKTY